MDTSADGVRIAVKDAGTHCREPNREGVRACPESQTGVPALDARDRPASDDLVEPARCRASEHFSLAERQLVNPSHAEGVPHVEIGIAIADSQIRDVANEV